MHLHPGKRFFLSVLTIVLLFSPEWLKAQQAQNIRIAGISVEGNTFADEQTIISLSGLYPGEEISPRSSDRLQLAIKNLWQRRQFADVAIEIERQTALGAFILIRVKEFPRFSALEVSGNDELSRAKIQEAVGKTRGDILSPYDAYLAQKAVKKLYDEEGSLFAVVKASIVPTDTVGYARLVLDINEGADFQIASVDFIGNTHFSESELRSQMEDTRPSAWWELWRSASFNQEKYEADKKRVLQFYRNNGFLEAEIIRDTLIFNEAEETVSIQIELNEGQQIFIRTIAFQGNTVFSEEVLRRHLNIQSGEPYNQERFEKNLRQNEDQTDVSSLYYDTGYLGSRIETDIKKVAPDSIDITVNIYENSRYTIRRVDIAGNTKTKDKVIRRELFTRPGDYFNRSALIRSVRALGVLNYFNPEALRPDVRPVDNTRVDLVYTVEERSTDTFNASVGFAGSFGLTGSVGFTFNNFSITEPLQGGAGQIFNLNAEFGQQSRVRTFSIGFTEPWLFDEPTTLGFNLYDTQQNLYYNLRRTGGSVNLGRRFRFPDDYFRGDWSVRFQRNDVQQLTNDRFYRPGVNTEFTLSQTISRISLDNLIFPTSGSRFSFLTQAALGAFGIGTTDFYKTSLNFEILNPLLQIGGFNRLVLYLNSEFSYVNGFESDTTIPPIERFYMGGNGLGGFAVTPLRGYPDASVGPASGGRVMSRYVAETRLALSLNPVPIYLSAFAEAGNVWGSLSETDPFNLKRSAGLGMRVLINPIGLLGFDYGYGFDPVGPTGEPSGWRFHFQFGR